MFELSSAWFGHPERKMKFVGVTGTNGKTSTVYYIKNILDNLGKKTGLIGTVANMIGDKNAAVGRHHAGAVRALQSAVADGKRRG